MLKLVLGRSGSGKTTYIQNAFAERARNGKGDMVLIVPEQFSFECERSLLNLLSAGEARKIEVLSFSRLADKLIEESPVALSILDKGKQAVVMSLAVQGVESELSVYKGKSEDFEFITDMIVFSQKMKRNCLTPERLREISLSVENAGFGKKLSDIAIITEAYEAVMENKFYDSDEKLSILGKILLNSDYFSGKFVAVDAFKGFTEQEMRIIEQILRQSEEVTVTLCTDGGNSKEPYSLFYCVDKTLERLKEAAKKANTAVSAPVMLNEVHRFKNDELRDLERTLFRAGAAKKNEKPQNIEIISANDIYAECDAVASRIKALLKDENYLAREIAVIYRNDAYETAMRSALRRFGVPVFDDSRQPLSAEPLIVMIYHAFSAVRSGYASEEVLKFLKCGLLDLTVEQISKVENYVYIWSIEGDGWKNEWVGNPRGYEKFSDVDESMLEALNKLRSKIIEPLEQFKKACANKTALGISEAVYKLLQKLNIRKTLKEYAVSLEERGEHALASEQAQSWNYVMKALDDICDILGDGTVSLRRYEQLFKFVVNSADIGKLPAGIDEVDLGNADRVRPSNPRAVFVVGLNDGQFPRAGKTRLLLTDNEMSVLQRMGELTTEEAGYVLSEERFLAYSALTCAGEKVFLSFSRSLLSGEETPPSSVVLQVKSIFFPENKNNSQSDDFEIGTESRMSLEKEIGGCAEYAFRYLASHWDDSAELRSALHDYFSGREDYAGRMQAIERIKSDAGFRIENPENSKKLFGEDIYVSATKAEEFHNCRFKYFCRFGLLISKRMKAGLDFMKSGLIVHYVMENVLKQLGTDGLLSATEEEINDLVEQYMNEYVEENMGGLEDKSPRFVYLFKRLKIIIDSVISRTVEEFSNSDFKFVDFELKIEKDGDIQPLTLPLKSGGSVAVHGSVDRVDLYEKDGVSYIRVVDYKTGKKKFRLSDVLCGLNMQMLIYLDCIVQNGGERYGKVEPAGVLYMLARREYADEGDAQKSRMEGIVLDDYDIVSAMEKGIKGVFVPVTAKGDELKGSVISAARLGALCKKIEETVTEMGEMLHAGDINDEPFYEDDNHNACKYCDYKSVCLNDGSDMKIFKKLKDDDVMKILDGEAE